MNYDNWKQETPPSSDHSMVEVSMLHKADALLEVAKWELEQMERCGHIKGFFGSYNIWKHEVGCWKRYINRIEKIKEDLEDEAG